MEPPLERLLKFEARARDHLTVAGGYVSLLMLRLLLGYEYFTSGLTKFQGSNWFGRVEFPFPFSVLSADVNWFLATWFELVGAALLIVGLATRYVAASLIVITLVAIYAAHLPEVAEMIDGERTWRTVGIGSLGELLDGYRISERCADGYCTGNYKLPVIYLFMFVPLLLSGGGKLAVDHWVDEWLRRKRLGQKRLPMK